MKAEVCGIEAAGNYLGVSAMTNKDAFSMTSTSENIGQTGTGTGNNGTESPLRAWLLPHLECRPEWE
jgi:hypothetical protein